MGSAASKEATSLYAKLRTPDEQKIRIAIGSDHAGFELKMKLLPYLGEYYEVTDCGCFSRIRWTSRISQSRSAGRS